MRPAQVADVWAKLREDNRRLKSIHLAWDGVPRLTSNVLQLARPFSVLCGENGVGKSTLLHLLYHALVLPDRRGEASVFVRHEEGVVEHVRVELSYGSWGAPRTLVTVEAVREHFGGVRDELKVALFDPAMHVPAILNAIHSDSNFAEEIEPLGPKIYTVGQIADLSYLVGRDYDAVRAYEIEGYGGLGVFPYFRVVVAGVEYGSESMGFGELSLLLSFWMLSRMPEGSVVLLEEPETFVSPRSQGRLANIAARFAVDLGLTIVATTHSPSIVSRFKENEITLVSRLRHTVSLTSPVDASVLERRLELINPVRRVWIVEDASAARVLKFFLARAGISSLSDVLIAGNNEGVIAAVSNLKAFEESRMLMLGILDGDERSRRTVVPGGVDFLPGARSPELMLKDFLLPADREVAAAAIGVSSADLELALAAAEGEESHQWFHAMRTELRVSLDQFVTGVLKAWSKQHEMEADQFCERLRELARA